MTQAIGALSEYQFQQYRLSMGVGKMHFLLKHGKLALIPIVAISALYGSAADAQQTATAEQAPSTSQPVANSEGALEEIVVTAQKRAENLQAAPIAVTALSSADLDNAGVREFTALEKLVPEVRVERIVSLPRISIRGIFATNLSPSSESPNAVFLDGGFLPKASALGGQFFDIERLEVLKGPQGTLYGRNANGGAVNIITNKPGKDFGATGEIEIGDYKLQRAEGALNLPISDTLSTRIAFYSYRHDGYYDNGLEDAGEQSVRFSALWTPDEQQRLLFTFDNEKINNRGQGVPNGTGSSLPTTVIPAPFDNTSIYGNDPPFFYRNNQDGWQLQYDYVFDAMTWTTQAVHRESESHDFTAAAPTSLDVNGQFSAASAGGTLHSGNFDMTTLETRLASNATRPLAWVVGGFFMHMTDSGFIGFGDDNQNDERVVTQGNPYQLSHAYALFGQTTYTPSGFDQLHLTAGGRYTVDIKHAITTTSGLLIPNPSVFDGQDKWKAFTWRGAIAYDLTPSSSLYASVARGIQPGGFAFAPAGENPEYKEEVVTSFELGSKNRFLQDRLQVNIDAYYSRYRDLSTVYGYLLPNPAGPPALLIGIANGAATYKGATVDVQWALTRADRLNVSVSWLKAVYGNYDLSRYASGNPFAEAQLFQLSGTRIPSTPPWTSTGSYEHTFQLGQHTLSAQVEAQYRDTTQTDTDLANTAAQVNTSVDRLLRGDFNLRYAPNSEKWYVQGYVRNFTNEVDYSVKSYTPNANGNVINGIPMQPRTFGVIIGAHF